MGKKEGSCYMWDETSDKRGANEVLSCLLDFIEKKSKLGVKQFNFRFDNCAGQNRNRIVFGLYLYASNKYKINIKHAFLERGHTQNEGDSVYALIENSSKNKVIYTPSEWFCLVRWAKINGDPYEVIEMDHLIFFDFKSQINCRFNNWSVNIQGNKINWTKIKKVSVYSNDPNKLYYRLDINVSSDQLWMITNKNTRQRGIHDLPPLYSVKIKISEDKKRDLNNLCKNNIIPERYHDFFKNLPVV